MLIKCFDPFLKSIVKRKTTDINGLRFRTCLSKLIHVGRVIKQLFHGCLVNSQNHSPSVPLMSRCTVPFSAPRGYSFDYSPNNHEITVYYLLGAVVEKWLC